MSRKAKQSNVDPQTAASNTYNDMAGGQKNISIGPKLVPIKLSETNWSCDATTARQCVAGSSLAIYNTSTSTVYSIRFGKSSSVAAAAAGAVDSDGNAAIPCHPGFWTYVAAGYETWFITQNAALLVYIIEDDSKL
jgi:hypothetical protein